MACYGVRRGEMWALGLTVALPAHYLCHLDTLDHSRIRHDRSPRMTAGAMPATAPSGRAGYLAAAGVGRPV